MIGIDIDDINSEEVFRLIIKNCTNLKSIAFDFNEISDELMEKFGLKFGEKIHKINFIKVDECTQIISINIRNC
jgi:hypothetical protein